MATSEQIHKRTPKLSFSKIKNEAPNFFEEQDSTLNSNSLLPMNFSSPYRAGAVFSKIYNAKSQNVKSDALNTDITGVMEAYRQAEKIFIEGFLTIDEFRKYADKAARKDEALKEFIDYKFPRNDYDLKHLKTGGMVKAYNDDDSSAFLRMLLED